MAKINIGDRSGSETFLWDPDYVQVFDEQAQVDGMTHENAALDGAFVDVGGGYPTPEPAQRLGR